MKQIIGSICYMWLDLWWDFLLCGGIFGSISRNYSPLFSDLLKWIKLVFTLSVFCNSCGSIDLQKSSFSSCFQEFLIARDTANLSMSEDCFGGCVGWNLVVCWWMCWWILLKSLKTFVFNLLRGHSRSFIHLQKRNFHRSKNNSDEEFSFLL